MKKFIKIYEKNRNDIEKFLITTLKNNGSILAKSSSHYKKLFQAFPSMELIYITDLHYTQNAPNVFRKKIEVSAKGQNREYLIHRMVEAEENFYVSTPYFNAATGHTCITIMSKENNQYIFIDFRLSTLLGRLGLIELHPQFYEFTKLFYKLIGFSLIILAFITVGYAIFSIFTTIFSDQTISLTNIFRPIITLILALVIFDFGKTTLEREVLFKHSNQNYSHTDTLTKFSIAMIIALSIEALLVIFNTTLHDASQMIHILYHIMGIALIIVALGISSYLTTRQRN